MLILKAQSILLHAIIAQQSRELYLDPWSLKENKDCKLVMTFLVSGMRKCPFPSNWNYFSVAGLSGALSVCSQKQPERSFLLAPWYFLKETPKILWHISLSSPNPWTLQQGLWQFFMPAGYSYDSSSLISASMPSPWFRHRAGQRQSQKSRFSRHGVITIIKVR